MESVRRALRDLGYINGQNLAIEYRYAEGRPERLPELSADLVRAKPDVLLSMGARSSLSACRAARGRNQGSKRSRNWSRHV
jgi:putative ABC transport system substrate-binding protein